MRRPGSSWRRPTAHDPPPARGGDAGGAQRPRGSGGGLRLVDRDPRVTGPPSDDDDVIDLLPAREGHFLLESGHHGDRWLDLETLCVDVAAVRDVARRLSRRLARYPIDAVC